jgi:hypothetical protein
MDPCFMCCFHTRDNIHRYFSSSIGRRSKYCGSSQVVSCEFLCIALVDCRRFIIEIEQKCFLCGEVEGAAIRCNDCNKEFHASCAWKQGHKFGFEIQPVSLYLLYSGETFKLISPSTRSRVVDEIRPPRLHLKANPVA